MLNACADIGNEPLDLRDRLMQDGQQDLALAGMTGQPAHHAQQLRATRDGLHPALRIRQPHVPTPPVVDQRHCPRTERAAFDVLRAVAAPAPLVLDFIESVLAVSTVPVELPHALRLVRRVAHQNRALPVPGRLVFVEQCQLGLFLDIALPAALFDCCFVAAIEIDLARAADHDDAPGLAPAHQAQRVFAPRPALPDIAPLIKIELMIDQLHDAGAAFELEQIRLPQ